jgi:hypothetical protein
MLDNSGFTVLQVYMSSYIPPKKRKTILSQPPYGERFLSLFFAVIVLLLGNLAKAISLMLVKAAFSLARITGLGNCLIKLAVCKT